MVTSLSIESPHTLSNARLHGNQILNLNGNRSCGCNLLIREATDVGMFSSDSLLLWYAHTLCHTAWSTFESDVAYGFSFPGSGVLAVCGGSFPLVKGPALVPHHVSIGCAFAWIVSCSCV